MALWMQAVWFVLMSVTEVKTDGASIRWEGEDWPIPLSVIEVIPIGRARFLKLTFYAMDLLSTSLLYGLLLFNVDPIHNRSILANVLVLVL